MKLFHGLLVILLIVVLGDVNGQIISPYQVRLRLMDDFVPVGGTGNICNGAVIHESYILTPASCLHTSVRGTNMSRPRPPSMVYVEAGRFDNNPWNLRFPEAFYIHENYSTNTLANDIALVKLTEPLQLRNNIAIQWIELASPNERYDNCFYSFQNQTSPNYPYTSPQLAYVMDSWRCNDSVNGTVFTERSNDICSHYTFSNSSMCNQEVTQYQGSVDRGTSLVCNNRLSGLLSQILPPQNVSNPAASCESTLKTWAYYTKVSNYVPWIHQTIIRTQPTPDPTATSQQPAVTPPPYSTPAQNNPQQQHPSTENPKGNGANSITISLTNVMLFFYITLILTFSR